jgi:beta-lactam-binding protein with PASTA domain
MTLSAAKDALARINCRVGKVSRAYSRSIKRGRVISQKPGFGAVLPKGSKVNLVISRGRKR